MRPIVVSAAIVNTPAEPEVTRAIRTVPCLEDGGSFCYTCYVLSCTLRMYDACPCDYGSISPDFPGKKDRMDGVDNRSRG